MLLTGARIVHTKEVAIHHYRDHDSEDTAISVDERTRNKERYKSQYYDKYAFLLDLNLFDRIEMGSRKLVWRCIKKLNKGMLKRGWQIETITGKNIKDWENLTKTRNISVFDLVSNRRNPYYLEQQIPRKFLMSANNPFRTLMD